MDISVGSDELSWFEQLGNYRIINVALKHGINRNYWRVYF
jgi:hypothetical protein